MREESDRILAGARAEGGAAVAESLVGAAAAAPQQAATAEPAAGEPVTQQPETSGKQARQGARSGR